jgi:hypothetical protein
MEKLKQKFNLITTIKQLKEIPITLFLLFVFATLFQYKTFVEYICGGLIGEDISMVDSYALKIPILSIIITKVASFLTIYVWVRIFIWVGFRNIHTALEELFNGKFSELTIWQRVLVSMVFLFGLLFAIIFSVPSGF